MSLRIGQVLKERYRIESILGEGGMGTVYKAQDLLLDRPRAIKELHPDPVANEARLHAARLQFEREAQALTQLRHKNLPHVSDYFCIDENDYLVMDYVQGESLADILARRKRPTEQLVYDWLRQVLGAIDYCHRHHVLHRDIKPANLVLTPQGRLILVDFSLVKFLDPHNPRTTTIVRGLGTPQYTPLEQYDASAGHTDARSDLYALGATFYHLLTGHPPQPVSRRILNPDTQPTIRELNPKVSTWMAVFIRKAMTIRPEDRYQSAREMRKELETRLFKLKRQPHAATSQVSGTGSQLPDERQLRRKPRHLVKRGWAKRSLVGKARRLLPAALPVLIPVTVVLTLTVIVVLVFSVSSSFLAALIVTPLVLCALAYHKLVSGRRPGPPRF